MSYIASFPEVSGAVVWGASRPPARIVAWIVDKFGNATPLIMSDSYGFPTLAKATDDRGYTKIGNAEGVEHARIA
jgi:hypothetical protein